MKPHHKSIRIDINPFGVVLINPNSPLLRDSTSTIYCIHSDGSYRRVNPRFTNLTHPKRKHPRTLKRCISAMVRAEFFSKGGAK